MSERIPVHLRQQRAAQSLLCSANPSYQAEYPDPSSYDLVTYDPVTYDPVTFEESEEALHIAGECIEAATRLGADPQLGVF